MNTQAFIRRYTHTHIYIYIYASQNRMMYIFVKTCLSPRTVYASFIKLPIRAWEPQRQWNGSVLACHVCRNILPLIHTGRACCHVKLSMCDYDITCRYIFMFQYEYFLKETYPACRYRSLTRHCNIASPAPWNNTLAIAQCFISTILSQV